MEDTLNSINKHAAENYFMIAQMEQFKNKIAENDRVISELQAKYQKLNSKPKKKETK